MKRSTAEYKRMWYLHNRERIKRQRKLNRETNKEKIAKQQKKWRELNRTELLERKKAYRLANKDFISASIKRWTKQNAETYAKQQLAYREANRDKISKRLRDYYRSEIGRAKILARVARNKAIRRAAEGQFTAEEWLALKLVFGNKCICCQTPEAEKPLTVDHTLPLSKGGSNWVTNIQPLCISCNDRKGAKYIGYRFIIPLWLEHLKLHLQQF